MVLLAGQTFFLPSFAPAPLPRLPLFFCHSSSSDDDLHLRSSGWVRKRGERGEERSERRTVIYYDSSGGAAAHLAARPALLCTALLLSPPSNIHSLFNTFLDSSPALNYIGKESLPARPTSASLDASRLSRALRARVRPLHHHDDDHVWGSNSLSFFLPPFFLTTPPINAPRFWPRSRVSFGRQLRRMEGRSD